MSILVTIAGPVGSGKSSVARVLAETLARLGIKAEIDEEMNISQAYNNLCGPGTAKLEVAIKQVNVAAEVPAT